MKIPELLAPAGTFETLIAVCNAGADAVYCAGSRFGARAYAGNLSDSELLDAINYVHLHGKKLYLTLNTLLKDSEINELYDYLLPLYENGLDGIIVQDLGAMEYLKLQFPELPIHISTQAAVMGIDAAEFFKENGADRVVLARELNIDEIKKIKDESDIEIEVFVHGALCYCYSGMCFYSSLIGGRSGNRGRCAQPCRMDYTINSVNKEWMSLKDLSALMVLDKLCEIGIDSLKIEGRMKNTEYAAGVTSVYRKYLDILKNGCKTFKVNDKDISYLNRLYQRRGFSDGYLFKHNGKDMILDDIPKKYEDRPDDGVLEFTKVRKRLVDFYAYFEINREATLIINDAFGNSVSVNGDICRQAANKPLDVATVKEKLSKINDTMLCLNSVNVEIKGDVFMPLSALNALRRKAVDLYIDDIMSPYHRAPVERLSTSFSKPLKPDGSKKISVSFLTLKQGYAVLKSESVDRVYFPYDLLMKNSNESLPLINDLKSSNKKVYLSMPEIFRDATKLQFLNNIDVYRSLFDGYLLKNYDELSFFNKHFKSSDCVLDFTVYSFNSFSVKKLKEYYNKLTASVELNKKELKQLDLTLGELVVYGRYPMMFTANCLIKNSKVCSKNSDILYYKDRKGFSFMVKSNCSSCYNTIYNAKRTSLLGLTEDINQLNVSYFRFSFTDENAEEISLLLNNFNDPEGYTRGHYIRGVE